MGLPVLLGPGLDHLHVEVDHLVVQPLKASKGQDVLDCDLDLVGIYQDLPNAILTNFSMSGVRAGRLIGTLGSCPVALVSALSLESN